MEDFSIKSPEPPRSSEIAKPKEPASLDRVLMLVKAELADRAKPSSETLKGWSAQILPGRGLVGDHVIVARETLVGETFDLESFRSKVAQAQQGSKELERLTGQLFQARDLDMKSGIHIVREGVAEAGPHEQIALEKYQTFKEAWHEVGRDLIKMANGIANPELRAQLMAHINEIYENTKHSLQKE